MSPLVVLLLLVLCLPSGILAATEDQLRDMCLADPLCAMRFSLVSSASSNANRRLFQHQLGVFLRAQNLTLDSTPGWLDILRTASFCGAGKSFIFGVGCVCNRPGNCDAPDPSKFVWEYWTFTSVAIGLLLMMVWRNYVLSDRLAQTRARAELIEQRELAQQQQQQSVIPRNSVVRTDGQRMQL